MLRPNTTPLLIALVATAALAFLLPSPDVRADVDATTQEKSDIVSHLEAGKAMRSGALMVVPIRQAKPATVLPVRVAMEHVGDLDIRMVADSRHGDILRLANKGDRGIFLPSGALFVGGTRDRMLQRDVVIAPQATTLVHTLPAAYERDQYAEPQPYRLMPELAPTYLRELASFDPSTYQVRTLLQQFAALLPADTEPPLSLANLITSDRLKAYCLACESDVTSFRKLITKDTVGFATFIHGRLQAFELFGSNALLQAHFEPILRAHAFKAAALTQHAKSMGIPLYDDGSRSDAKARAESVVRDTLRDLRGAMFERSDKAPEGAEGQAWTLRTHRAKGTMLQRADRVVHLALFVHDPYEEALYARELDEPQGDRRDATSDEFTSRKARERRDRRNDLLPDDAAKKVEDARKGDAIRKSLRPLDGIR